MLVGQAVSITYTPLCEFIVGVYPDRECGEAAATTLVFGCRHEHVDRVNFCATHRGVMLRSRVYCRDCDQAPEPHRHTCYPLIRDEGLRKPTPTPLSGPVYVERLPVQPA